MIRRAFYIVLILLLLVPATHAAWDLSVTSLPMVLDSDSKTVVWTKLTNGSTPINLEDCVEGTMSVRYQYQSEIGFLKSIGNGVWIAEYDPTTLPMNLSITAQGDCSGTGTATEEIRYPANGGLNVELINFGDSAPQGSQKVILVNISNATGIVSGAIVQYKIYDLLDPSSAISEGELSQTGQIYNATISIPTDLGNYSCEITATSGTNVGGDGRLFHTIETISGNVTINGTDNKCVSSNGLVTSCELNSVLNFEFEEGVGNPTKVWVEMWGTNLIERVNLTNSTEGDQKYWRGVYSLPENYNLSKTKESQNNEITFKVIAADEFENYTISTSDMNLITYWTISSSKYSVRPGELLDISFEVVKPYSGDHLSISDLEGFNVSVYYKSAPETEILVKNYTLSDMTYSDDIFHLQHRVQEDTLDGTYVYKWNMVDSFGHNSSDSIKYKEFSVISHAQSGPVIINRSAVSNSFEELGLFYEVLDFNNTDSSRVIVRPIILGDVSEIVFGDFVLDENDASEDGKYIIEANTSKEFIIGYNITNNLSENYDGTLVIRVFSDLQGSIEKYRTELPLETQIGGKTTNGTLQVNVNQIERTFFDPDTYIQNITVFNKGLGNITVNLDTQGTIRQITSVFPTELTIAPGEYNYAVFTQTVDVSDNGIYGGYYIFNTTENKIKIPVNITADISGSVSGKLKVTVDNASLGSVIKGDQLNITVEVKNIGESNLSNFTASTLAISNLYTITNSEGIILEPEEIIDLKIIIHTEKLSEGVDNTRKLIISAEPNAENFTYISLKINSNYSSKFGSLNGSILTYRSDLESILNEDLQENKTDLESNIKQLEGLIEKGIGEWNNREYNASKITYITAEELSNEIHSGIRALQNYVPPTPDERGGGSAKAWILIVIFIILIIVGVVIYLSLVPE